MPNERFQPLTWHRAVLSEDCTLDPYETVVLLALVRFANESGRAFPGFSTLCRVTRVSRRQLVRAIDALEQRGVFRRLRQTRGKGIGSNTYQLPTDVPDSALQALVTQATTSAPQALGSAPQALGVVPARHSGSAYQAPYLISDLLKVTDQVTAEAPTSAPHALSGPKTAKAKRASKRKAETALPEEWQPTDAHRAFAAQHGLELDLEVVGFKGRADGMTAVSWNGRFTTWLSNQAKWNRQRGRGKAPTVQSGGYAGRPKTDFERELEAGE